MTPPPAFALTDSEKQQPLWLRLKAHLTDKLDKARTRNDGALTEQQTADLRGEIRSLKSLIRLGESGQPTGE